MAALPPIPEMHRACQTRDPVYDGIFFLAVRTTGIFCRPTCPARKPRPANVEYFATAAECILAGYRACKRCRPLSANGAPPTWVRRLQKIIDDAPARRIRDDDLRRLGITPVRARRYFTLHHGMTFQAYHRARRLGAALRAIQKGNDMTTVAADHGFDSLSGFRDAFTRQFGRPPGAHDRADCLVTRQLESPVGPLTACASKTAICLLEFTDRRMLKTQFKTLQRRFDRPVLPGDNALLRQLARELAEYFAGRRRQFDVPLDAPGTPFQTSVWSRLLEIPYGETISYERLARDVGRPTAQRAVGRTNGDNRIAILIPCHRVVNKSGKLGGYGGGLWRKQFLLNLEQSTLGAALI